MNLSEKTRVVASAGQVSCDLGGEAVLLHLDTGVYYSLEGLGADIWKCLQAPKTIAEIRESLLADYDVDAARCDIELREFLEQLADRGLIRVEDPPCAPCESC